MEGEKERVCELEDRTVEITQTEGKHTENKKLKDLKDYNKNI